MGDDGEDGDELELGVGGCGTDGGVGWLGGVEQPAPASNNTAQVARSRSGNKEIMGIGASISINGETFDRRQSVHRDAVLQARSETVLA